jgi:methylmalonyl-CoA/ethylmalonyl-CoA epimerase
MDTELGFNHIGMIVKDLSKTIAYMQQLGIFEVPPSKPEVLVGKSPNTDAAAGSILKLDISLGGVNIEIIQPVSGNNIQQQFLSSHGEGLHHICFDVPNIQRARLELAEKGVPVACHISEQTTYYDTGEYGNMLLEIRQS